MWKKTLKCLSVWEGGGEGNGEKSHKPDPKSMPPERLLLCCQGKADAENNGEKQLYLILREEESGMQAKKTAKCAIYSLGAVDFIYHDHLPNCIALHEQR
jgi:hypothetical protein